MPSQFKLGLIGQVSSGIPYSVTSGVDLKGDGIVADRPIGIARNTGDGPVFFQLDARLSRRFVLINTEGSGKKSSAAPYAEFSPGRFQHPQHGECEAIWAGSLPRCSAAPTRLSRHGRCKHPSSSVSENFTGVKDGKPRSGISKLLRRLAAPQGFEPRYADPESAVLPLNEGAAARNAW
jgi:hypothetical protein